MSKEECVEFEVEDGVVLRGILHRARSSNRKNISLICLNTGLNDMVGWHRLQVKVARFLADIGYDLLRFDDVGIGDSDGEILSNSIVEIFADIETGKFVDNALSAASFMESIFPTQKQVYLGYCGGGLTGVYAANRNKNILAVVNIGGPVTLSSDEYLQKKDPWEVKKNVANYRSKLFSLKPWLKLLTFKGDYKNIFTTCINYVKQKLRGELSDIASSDEIDSAKNLNRLFFSHFKRYVESKRKSLFFYADTDSATWELKKFFMPIHKNTFEGNSPHTFFEVCRANHILSSTESQQVLKETLKDWLQKL